MKVFIFTLMRLFILCAFGQTLIFADEPSSSFNRFNFSGYNEDYENNHGNIYITESPQKGLYPRAYDNYNNPTYLTDFKSSNNYYPENSFTNENYQQNYNYAPSTELEPPKRNYFAFTTGWSSTRRSNSYLPPREISSDSSSSKHTLHSNYYSSPQVISGAYLSSNRHPNRHTSYTESNYPSFFTTTSSSSSSVNTKTDDVSRSTVTTRPLYLRSSTTKSNEYASYPSVELFKPIHLTATPPTKVELADSYAPPILRNLRILDQNRQYLPPSTPRSVYGLSTSTASINIPLPLYSAPLSNQRKDTETFRDDVAPITCFTGLPAVIAVLTDGLRVAGNCCLLLLAGIEGFGLTNAVLLGMGLGLADSEDECADSGILVAGGRMGLLAGIVATIVGSCVISSLRGTTGFTGRRYSFTDVVAAIGRCVGCSLSGTAGFCGSKYSLITLAGEEGLTVIMDSFAIKGSFVPTEICAGTCGFCALGAFAGVNIGLYLGTAFNIGFGVMTTVVLALFVGERVANATADCDIGRGWWTVLTTYRVGFAREYAFSAATGMRN
uniref:DUF4203 domain-containing protein n=1 Tax=Glossina austeni TaxID=7395 RepID=A0A1A9V4A3_GLOAU